MEKIILNDSEIKYLKKLGEGSGGVVYLLDDETAVKCYSQGHLKHENYENKFAKLDKLRTLNLDNFITPKNLVYNDENIFKGFTMNYQPSDSDLFDYFRSSKYTLDQKIDKFKKLENLVKKAHEQGITLVDTHFWNFLVHNDEIKVIDTDAFKVGLLKEDFEPPFYCHYYKENISNIIDSNLDKFSLGIHLLNLLSNGSFNSTFMLFFNTSYNYLYNYILLLDTDPMFKEFLYELVSDSKQKIYFDDNIDLISSSKSFIKSKI